MRKPATKPSVRIAAAAAKAAAMQPDVARLLNHFPLEENESWQMTNLRRAANKRIEELVLYINALNGGAMVLAMIDMRGEREVLLHLVESLVRELEIAAGIDDHAQDHTSDRSSHDDTVPRLIESARAAMVAHNFSSYRRLRGEKVGFS